MIGRAELAAAIAALENSIATLDRKVLFFGVLVAVGVTGEVVLGIRHWIMDRQLRNFRHQESQLHDTELEQLRNRTAEANEKAEAERLARVKLEASLLGRSLSSDQADALAKSLSQFPNTGVMLIRTLPGSEEIRLATLGILNVLQQANWRVTTIEARRSLPVFGVWIELSPEADDATVEGAQELARGLTAAGWETQGPFQQVEEVLPVDPSLQPTPLPLVQVTVGFHRYLPPKEGKKP